MTTPDDKAAKAAEKAERKAAKEVERSAKREASSKKREAFLDEHGNDASLDTWMLRGRNLSRGAKKHDIAGAKAEFEHGANVGSRVTLTRIALTGIFAFGLKKNKNKVYVLVELADGSQEIIEAKAKDEMKARKFAEAINKAGVHFAEQSAL